MFVVSMKARRRHVLSAIVIVLCLILAAMLYAGSKKAQETSQMVTVSVNAANNGERISYLKSFGWTVSEEACEIVEVAIPESFDDVYKNYNEIQKKQGFDLEPYRGKRVKRFTYEVKNYPGVEENIRANMLVYNHRIIGGDICSTALDGFMHGFSLPKNKK